MLVGGVVDDEVHHQLDPPLVEALDQLVQIIETAEQRIHLLVVGDVVPVVVLWGLVDRRQPDHIHPKLAQVVEPAQDPPQITDPVAVGDGVAPPVVATISTGSLGDAHGR